MAPLYMRIELCPFCNGECTISPPVNDGPDDFDDWLNKYCVICPTCGASGPDEDEAETAISKWNVISLIVNKFRVNVVTTPNII